MYLAAIIFCLGSFFASASLEEVSAVNFFCLCFFKGSCSLSLLYSFSGFILSGVSLIFNSPLPIYLTIPLIAIFFSCSDKALYFSYAVLPRKSSNQSGFFLIASY
ncbi:unknown [Rickettsia conorii str. Malish 7]|uniref:Uncharacterized protein n=1 Tax=Rickettsia conorii (strain ATCC VR-613 / Malish 7) TaxID=272944 RepID=Q92HE4_RICCN|nr:unknown [Rickettsia conorii str. Malish 7]